MTYNYAMNSEISAAFVKITHCQNNPVDTWISAQYCTVQYSTLYSGIHHIMLQYSTVQCNIVQHSKVQYSTV